jgi:hypothetical protein
MKGVHAALCHCSCAAGWGWKHVGALNLWWWYPHNDQIKIEIACQQQRPATCSCTDSVVCQPANRSRTIATECAGTSACQARSKSPSGSCVSKFWTRIRWGLSLPLPLPPPLLLGLLVLPGVIPTAEKSHVRVRLKLP